MKIEFELELTELERELAKHLAVENGITLDALLGGYAKGALDRAIMARKIDIAGILAKRMEIEDQLIRESFLLSEARKPIW